MGQKEGTLWGKFLIVRNESKMKAETIIPVVVAGIVRNGNVLLLKRNREPFKGLWSLPGGKIGVDEFVTDALEREIFEETKLSLMSIKFLGIVSELVTCGDRIVNGHLISVFLGEVDRTKIEACSEGDLRWFAPVEIVKQKDEIIPTDFLIISMMVLKKKKGAYLCLVERKEKEYCLIKYEKM